MENEEKKQDVHFTTSEYLGTLQKLIKAEAKIKEFEQVTKSAKQEMLEMQNAMEIEQMKSEQAVTIASQMFKQNTVLRRRTMTMTQRSKARQKWMEESLDTNENKADDEKQPQSNEANQDLDEDELSSDSTIDLMGGLDMEDSDEEDVAKEKSAWKRKLEKAGEEMQRLQKEVDHYKRMSAVDSEELRQLKEKLDVESHVRKNAETFAAKMYGENRSWMRQSMIRSTRRGSGAEDSKLEEALKDIKNLNEQVEKLKIEHRQKVEELEKILASSNDNDEIDLLEEKVNVLGDRVRHLEEEKSTLETKCQELEKELEELKTTPPAGPASSVPPPPAIPIPPPPPLPANVASAAAAATAAAEKDPLSALKELVNNRKNARTAEGGTAGANAKSSGVGFTVDRYANAMAEMMERIKRGNVALRRAVRQDSSDESDSTDEFDTDDFKFDFSKKAATLDNRTTRLHHSKSEEKSDIFDNFRKGLNPVGASRATKTRRVSTPEGNVDFRAGLRRIKFADANTKEEAKSETAKSGFAGLRPLRSKMVINRDVQGSVKHPNEVSPELKAILDKKRKASRQQALTK